MKRIKVLPLFLAIVMVFSLFPALGTSASAAPEPPPWSSEYSGIELGIEVLLNEPEFLDQIRGKNVALYTNQIGVDQGMESMLNLLVDAADVEIVALFGAEHGVRGQYQAGAPVNHGPDPENPDIWAWSLYNSAEHRQFNAQGDLLFPHRIPGGAAGRPTPEVFRGTFGKPGNWVVSVSRGSETETVVIPTAINVPGNGMQAFPQFVAPVVGTDTTGRANAVNLINDASPIASIPVAGGATADDTARANALAAHLMSLPGMFGHNVIIDVTHDDGNDWDVTVRRGNASNTTTVTVESFVEIATPPVDAVAVSEAVAFINAVIARGEGATPEHLQNLIIPFAANLVDARGASHLTQATALTSRIASIPGVGALGVEISLDFVLDDSNDMWHEPIDIVLFDLPDIGSKTWTYIYTLADMMRMINEYNNDPVSIANGHEITLFVLDRPNPLGGLVVEGPMGRMNAGLPGIPAADPRSVEYFTNMSMNNPVDGIGTGAFFRFPIPSRHGMTIGEIALMFAGEWDHYWMYPVMPLDMGDNLVVVPVRGWDRSMHLDDIPGFQFVLPSPNMPTYDAALAYTGTVWHESTNTGEGRGTTFPFTWVGAPYIDGFELAGRLNSFNLPGVRYRPASNITMIGNQGGVNFAGQLHDGVEIYVYDKHAYRAIDCILLQMMVLRSMYGIENWVSGQHGRTHFHHNSPNNLHQRTGNMWVQREIGAIAPNATNAEIEAQLARILDLIDEESAEFLTVREQYLMLDYGSPDPTTHNLPAPEPVTVTLGFEALLANHMDLVDGLNVGLVADHTAVDSRLNHVVDMLMDGGVNITRAFAPAPGLRGLRQDHQFAGNFDQQSERASFPGGISYADGPTGLTVYRLADAHTVPTAEMLEDLDVLLFDMQDSGVRYSSRIGLLADVMKAAAEHDVQVVVLDRPAMLGGRDADVDGPVSETGPYAIPIRYSMTIGELALMLRYELGHASDEAGENAFEDMDLAVVRVQSWNRADHLRDTGMPFVMPTIDLPHYTSALLYSALGMVRNTELFEGWGVTKSYEFVGHPFIQHDVGDFVTRMNALELPAIRFRTAVFAPWNTAEARNIGGIKNFNVAPQTHTNPNAFGAQIHVYDHRQFAAMETMLSVFEVLMDMFPAQMDTDAMFNPVFARFTGNFDNAVENTWLQPMIRNGYTAAQMMASPQYTAGLSAFMTARAPHLIYPESTHVFFTATQLNGVAHLAETQSIQIRFSQPVTGVSGENVTIINDTGAVIPGDPMAGAFSGSGQYWTFELNEVVTQGNVLVSVSDFGAFTVTSGPRTVAVYRGTDIPVITTTTLPPGDVNTAWNIALEAISPHQPLAWTVLSGEMPAGLTLNTAGVISGTPTVAGVFPITVRVEDAQGGYATEEFALIVDDPNAPVITTEELPPGTLDTVYSTTLHATSPYALTWRLATGTLPPGLTLSEAGVISGTPTELGLFTFTVEVEDPQGRVAGRELTLRIDDESDPLTEPRAVRIFDFEDGVPGFVNTDWVAAGSYDNEVEVITVDPLDHPNALHTSRVYAGERALHWTIRDQGTPASSISAAAPVTLEQKDGANPTSIGFWIRIEGDLGLLHTDRPVRMGLVNGTYKWWNVPVNTGLTNQWQWVEVQFNSPSWGLANQDLPYDPNQPIIIPGPGTTNTNAFLWMRKLNTTLMEAEIFIDNITLLYGGITGAQANYDRLPPSVEIVTGPDSVTVIVQDLESGLDRNRLEILVNGMPLDDEIIVFSPRGLTATANIPASVLTEEVNEIRVTAWDNFGFVTVYEGTDEFIPSTDATLHTLRVVSEGEEDKVIHALDRAFGSDADNRAYTAAVPHDVDEVAMDYTTTCDEATVVITRPATSPEDPPVVVEGPLYLALGDNVFTITVTAEDGTTYRVYTVTVVRAATPTPVITITEHPANVAVTAGAITGTLTAAATVTEEATLSFQWYQGGTAIAGATSAALTIPTNLTVGSHAFHVVVSATGGAAPVTSEVATVTVNAPTPVITITEHPANVAVTAGAITGNLTAAATVTEEATLSFQWYQGGTAIAGATSATLTIPTNLTVGTHAFHVVVSATGGAAPVTSKVATVTVNAPTPVITITEHPANVAVTAGAITGNLTVAATVTEEATLSFQWYQGGTAIAGATSAALTIPTNLTVGTHAFHVVVSATGGAAPVTSEVATVTVNAPTPVITITEHPANVAVTAGAITGTLTVAATVTEEATLSFQWYQGGTAIAGATGATLTIPTNLTVGSHAFHVVVSATGGAAPVTSGVATVTVNAPTRTLTLTPDTIAITNERPTGITVIGGSAGGAIELDYEAPAGVVVELVDNVIVVTGVRPAFGAAAIDETFAVTVSRDEITATLLVTVDLTPIDATLTLTPDAITIDDTNLTATVEIGGTATGAVMRGYTAPAGVTVAVVDGDIVVTGVRPAYGQAAIDTTFDVTVTRDGATATLPVTVNLTPAAPPVSTLTLTPDAVTITNERLTGITVIGGTATGAIELDYTAPAGVTVDVVDSVILVTGVRPAHGAAAIDETFAVTVSRGGIDATLLVTVNLTPVDATLTLTPDAITIDDTNLTATVEIGGTATGAIMRGYTAPAGVTVAVIDGDIVVTGVRPAYGQGAVNTTFEIAVSRGGATATLPVTVNLTPVAGPTEPDVEIEVEVEDGNVTINVDPDGNYTISTDGNGNMVITLPDAEPDDDISISLPDNWVSTPGTDGAGNVIVTITPPAGYEVAEHPAGSGNLVVRPADPLVVNRDALRDTLAEAAEREEQGIYSDASWAAFVAARDAAQAVYDNPAATQAQVDAAAAALRGAMDALVEFHPAYMFGNTAGHFEPRANITRAQVAAILARTMIDGFEAGELPEGMTSFTVFSDVAPNNWFYYYVAWAYTEGLVQGDGQGRFLPRDYITREQLAAMLARTVEYAEAAGAMPFTDVGSISSWASNYVYTAFSEGWMVGDNQNRFRPRASIARAEVATAVNRILGRIDSRDVRADLLEAGALENENRARPFPDVADGAWYFASVLGAANDHYLTRDGDGDIDWKYVRLQPE
ncbi:MAG: DUF1343 domain-containing protein [Oscillospiraceae bacterium]|nr:DUF1343 domain-containing protein [Oscillospiraceae bacterium]